MTHEYTLLLGGTVIPGSGAPDVTAIAWADDTVLALGTDEEVGAISRGDSHLVRLEGAFVVPLAPNASVTWPGPATLEVGGLADLVVLGRDPRLEPGGSVDGVDAAVLAVVRGGRVMVGALPGVLEHDHGSLPVGESGA